MRNFPLIAISVLLAAAMLLLGMSTASVSNARSPPDPGAIGCHGEDDSVVQKTGCHGANASGCHGEKAAAGCHGRTAVLARKHASRVSARADRREAARTSRDENRASREASRSCHGSGGTGNTRPAAQPDDSPQSSPCVCPPNGCACRR